MHILHPVFVGIGIKVGAVEMPVVPLRCPRIDVAVIIELTTDQRVLALASYVGWGSFCCIAAGYPVLRENRGL